MSEAKPDTGPAVVVAVSVAVLMIAQQLAGKALRDAYFLTQYEATTLPTIMMVASLISVGAVIGTSQLFRRFEPARLVPLVFFLSGAWFCLEWLASSVAPRAAAVSLYIHTTSFGAVVVSGFWSVVNERFDPHTAKQVIGRIAGGATVGGVLGGLAAWQGAAYVSIGGMVLILAGANVVCGLGVMRLGGGRKRKRAAGGAREPSALAIMEETPYLWHLAGLVALSALAASAFDYVFKARAAATLNSGEDLVSFFALFYLGLGIATFVFQQLFAKRALALLGLTATVATMPGTVVVLGGLALFAGGLWSALLLRGGAAVIESSLYRSGYELLYTPLTPEKKRPTKTLIDVGGDKLGAAVGSGLALGIVAVTPSAAEGLLLVISIVAAVAALLLCGLLHRGYVASLADSLRSGAIDGADLEDADRITMQTVVATVGLDQARARALLETQSGHGGRGSMRPGGRGPEAPAPAPVDHAAVLAGPVDTDDTLRAVAALRSREPERVRAALALHAPLPAELVPHTLPLLANEAVGDEAKAALRRVAPRITGALSDQLLSPRTPLSVRAEIAGLLEAVPTRRSLEALQAALLAEEFSLRVRCAIALEHLVRRVPKLEADHDAIVAAIEYTATEAQRRGFGVHLDPERASDTLAYAFVLLSTILPPEPLRLALDAVADESPGRRGTGLEYLENVIPASLKASLRGLFEARQIAVHANRAGAQLVHDVDQRRKRPRLELSALVARLRADVAATEA